VVRRRVQFYRSRKEFAVAAGVGKRTIDKVETGAPGRYQPRTIDGLDRALHWVPGSFVDTLGGGLPEPVTDATLQQVLDAWPMLSQRDREAVLSLVTSLLRQ
jgi:hypothetical protein